MNCRKYQKLIHRLQDGDLDRKQTREVCEHLEHCPQCHKLHADLVRMCASLKEDDPETPPGFRQRWQAELAGAQITRKPSRARIAVPVAACCAAAVIGISTLLNPQAFGLEGNSLTSEWFAVKPSALLEENIQPADQGTGQKVSNVSTTEKKPNLLDFDSSNYSETTTKASGEPALYQEGAIEPAQNEVLNWEALLDEAGEALPDGEEQTIVIDPENDMEELASLAAQFGCTVTQREQEILIEGTPEQMAQFAAQAPLELPEGTQLLRLISA